MVLQKKRTGQELDIFVNDGGSIMEHPGWSLKWFLELHSVKDYCEFSQGVLVLEDASVEPSCNNGERQPQSINNRMCCYKKRVVVDPILLLHKRTTVFF